MDTFSVVFFMILYFFFVGKRIVLINGFVKKSMKTPKSAIELAVKYKNDYIERYI